MNIFTPSVANNKKVLLFSSFFRGLEYAWAPILVLFMMSKVGLSIAEIFILQALFAFMNVLLEVPSGIIADRLGRKNTVVFGFILFAIAIVVFNYSQTFWHVLLGEFLAAIGSSAISGAKDALLYDSLKETKQTDQYKKVTSTMYSRQFFIGAFASFFGGILASKFGFHVPILISAAGMFTLAGVLVFLKEPKTHDPSQDKTTIAQYGIEAFKHIGKSSYLIWLMVFTIAMGLTYKTSFFIYNPYWEMKNVPLEWFGYAIAGYSILCAIISHYAHTIIDFLGNTVTKYILTISCVLGFGLLTLTNISPLWAVLIPAFFQIERSLSMIFINDILHSHTDSHNRATVISVKAFLVQASQMIFLPIFGILSDTSGLIQTLLYTAGFIGLLAFIATFFIKKKEVLAE